MQSGPRALNRRGSISRADPALSFFSDLAFEAGLVARSIGDYFAGGGLRLGVTGLSRSGKTVFLTALVNNLDRRRPAAGARRLGGGTHHPGAARAAARRRRAALRLRGASGEPRRARTGRWPQSTRRISQLRLTIEFESAAGWSGAQRQPGDRPRRLSRRMAARPAAARQVLRRPGRARRSRASETPARAPLSAGLAGGARRASTRTPKPNEDAAPATSPSASPPICARRATTSMRSRPCRPAAS